jgi:hypothetical protein
VNYIGVDLGTSMQKFQVNYIMPILNLAKGPQPRCLRLRVALGCLRFDLFVGQILDLIKKISLLCLVHSRVSSPKYHPLTWVVVEWVVIAGPLVMKDYDSKDFLNKNS